MKTYVFSDEHNCDHTYVLAADAQATVEALQSQVKALQDKVDEYELGYRGFP